MRLDPDAALDRLARARALGFEDRDLDLWARSAEWVRAHVVDRGSRADLAQAFARIPVIAETSGLDPAAARFLDEVVARRALRMLAAEELHLAGPRDVTRGELHLACGEFAAAHTALRALTPADRDARPQTWAALGDACWLLRDFDAVHECYVRALLLDARQLHQCRMRHEGLRDLLADLIRLFGLFAARERLLAEAWIQRELRIVPGRGLLDADRLDALDAQSAQPADEAARARRFSFLLFIDRTRDDGELQRREEMQALDPDLFARFVAVLPRS